jgi:hypothetical protein
LFDSNFQWPDRTKNIAGPQPLFTFGTHNPILTLGERREPGVVDRFRSFLAISPDIFGEVGLLLTGSTEIATENHANFIFAKVDPSNYPDG